MILDLLAVGFRLGVLTFHLFLFYRMVKLLRTELPWLRETLRKPLPMYREHGIQPPPDTTQEYLNKMGQIAWFAMALQLWEVLLAVASPSVSSLTGFFGIASPAVVVLISLWPKRLEAERIQEMRALRFNLLRELDRTGPSSFMELRKLSAFPEGRLAPGDLEALLQEMGLEGLVDIPHETEWAWSITDTGRELLKLAPLMTRS